MSDNGVDSGARNVGRFFLALIPWAIGIGVLVWLSVFVGVHTYRREVAQEQRAAAYVGAAQRPEGKLKLQVLKRDCSTVTRVDVDGSDLTMYAKNKCGESLDYLAWHWELRAASGTVLRAGYTNTATCPVPRNSGDEAECRLTIKTDDRAETLTVWTKRNAW